ncbi:FecR domain-containing protein [Fulvivirgaceae bacterium BMA12]|uniref:FecR domain-containing protein n=1 Tax=Agaribacillus aureus TaxID=3051825 RepID=A0ABT8LEH5_9BACT|nr:FecR domain-containing protein [Fulvivirgaceae bacterium BMA12]
MDSKNHLIGKFLKDEISQPEREELDTWLSENEGNRVEFDLLKKIWDRTGRLRKDQTVEVNEAWSRFVEMRDQKRSRVILMPGWAWRVAAMLVIGISLSYLAWEQWRRPDMIHIVTRAHKQSEISLPDGTRVWLNRNSKLTYPEAFTGSDREVQLEGEAFFEVIRNEAQPFVITASDVAVRVLGTSFNVKSEIGLAEVVVATGQVALYELENEKQQVILNPSDKGIFIEKSGKLIKKQNTDPNFLAWKTGKLVFENMALGDVVNTISTVYDKQIELGNTDLSTCRINTAFDSQPLEEILEEISLLLDVTYNAYPNKIVINGKGCGDED